MKSQERNIFKSALNNLNIPFAKFKKSELGGYGGIKKEGYQWPRDCSDEVNIYYRTGKKSKEVCLAIISDLKSRGFNAELIDNYTVKLHRKTVSNEEANIMIGNMARNMGLL